MVIIFSFTLSFKPSHNFNIQNSVSTGMWLGVGSFVDTEIGFCFKIRKAENLFGIWCDMNSNKFLEALLVPEFVTQNLLYKNRHINLAYLYSSMKKRHNLRNSAFGHQMLPFDFFNHAHNCQFIYRQQVIELRLHVCDIDIYMYG